MSVDDDDDVEPKLMADLRPLSEQGCSPKTCFHRHLITVQYFDKFKCIVVIFGRQHRQSNAKLPIQLLSASPWPLMLLL